MNDVLFILAFIGGSILTWIFILLSKKFYGTRIEEELKKQISNKDEQISQLRKIEVTLTSEKASALTAQEASQQQLKVISDQNNSLAEQLKLSRAEFNEQSIKLATALADLEATRNLLNTQEASHQKIMKDARDAQDKAIIDLKDTFKALSADALKENAPAFLSLANQEFSRLQVAANGELDQRKEAISGLLKPLEEQLKTYQERLQQSDNAQSQVLGGITSQLSALTKQSESLANETERFRMVLKSNQARGKWGEETLRRVVEAAGLSVHCDFIEQAVNEDKKPDMIVKLPGDRVIIVDAKVPDLDFITALETSDLETRQQLLKAHALKLRETVKALADRDYPSQFQNALDHVVLFLPAESLFSAALEGDHDIIIWAASKKITLATPASFIALLRCVSISWQQSAQTENIKAIAVAAQELYSRVVTLTGHFKKIGDGLYNAQEAFNKAVGSYERMVRPSGERLIELGLKTDGKVLTEIQTIDVTPRLTSN